MNVQNLLKRLQKVLETYVPERRQLPVLLASFSLSLILWILVTLADTYQTSLEVNVKLGADNTVVVNHNPEYQVLVGLEGSGLDLFLEHLRFRRDTVHLEFDPSLLEVTSLQVDEHRALFAQSFGPQVKILNLYPDVLPIDFALKDRKRVPVILATDISLPPGYQLSDTPRLLQDSVWIIGAADRIDTITSWPTLAGYSPVVQERRDISIPMDTSLRISTDPADVPISVNPVPFAEWTLSFPVRTIGDPIGTSVRMSHPEITLMIALPQQLKDSLIEAGGFPVKEFLIPYASLVERGAIGWKPTNDLLPPGTRIVTLRPERITYTTKRSQSGLN